jgi:hypothetical protein
MGSGTSRIGIVCALGLGLLLWPGATPASSARRGGPAFGPGQGQEVVNGSYYCDGTVYTDEQAAQVSANVFLSATSGITDGLFGAAQNSANVPADLDAMAAICEDHVGEVLAQVPAICTLGPVAHEGGEFGNGANVVVRFDFSCQGTRDEVIGVIGGFSRLSLTARLP